MTHSEEESKYPTIGASLAVQWLRHHVSISRGTDLIPGRGSKIPHAMWHGQIKKSRRKETPKYSTSIVR